MITHKKLWMIVEFVAFNVIIFCICGNSWIWSHIMCLLLPFVPYLYRKETRSIRIIFKEMGLTSHKLCMQIILGLGVIFIPLSIGFIVFYLCSMIFPNDYKFIFHLFPSSQRSFDQIVYIALSQLFISVTEELFFRSYYDFRLSEIVSIKWIQLFIAAFIFALPHTEMSSGILPFILGGLNTFSANFMNGYLKYRIKNYTIISCIIQHTISNYIMLFVYHVSLQVL